MDKDKLIEIDELIKELKANNISIGKGNPYNTLRYYTKIGWLPNMQRKKAPDGNVKGHYPIDTIEKLKRINELKKQGISNEDIQNILETTNKITSVKALLKNKEFLNKLYKVATILILILLVIIELGFIDKNNILSSNEYKYSPNSNNNMYVLETGTFFIPKNRSSIYIKSNNINETTKILINFKQTYSPAFRYWYEIDSTRSGFYVKLDAPVIDDTYFDWWITK